MDSIITKKIKNLGDERSGSALIELMDFYGVNRLRDISQAQAEAFYKMKIHSEERCILCDTVIPEGRQVCYSCEEKW